MEKAAQIVTDKSQQILAMWEDAVKQKVEASRRTNNIVLRNHLPNMINDIADILVRYDNVDDAYKDKKYQEIVENSADHGRHRAASEAYTISQVIHEYIIFHRTLTKVLRSHGVYSTEIADLLKYTIETAILQSATAFNNSLQEMQETLVGTLAHDIRNPLSTAYSLLELMSSKTEPEKLDLFRQMAVRSIKKSLELTEGLLDTITVKAGEGMMLSFVKGDITKEIRTVYEEACQVYNREIVLQCSDETITGVVDGTAIRRVLENLLTNAIKYGDMSKPVTIDVEDNESTIKISVHNLGNPIPAERQQSIFNFLDRGSEKNTSQQPSWGLGLTLVKVITEAHGGYVALISNEEEGTRFTLVISRHNESGKRRTRIFNRE